LIAEDQSLFERGTYLQENPILYNYQMLWRLGPLPPVTYLVSTDETDLLNTLKLTTRSKGNFRFGVYNAVTGPLKA
ncbi:MAG: hypothetical protein IT260_10980, partial [Saprospiraceae bacterium]|nr:hypothetical protein [Saprospiraceae bacterium]